MINRPQLITILLLHCLLHIIDSSCNPSIVFVTVYTGAIDEPRGADTIPPPPSHHNSIYFSDNPTILQTARFAGWKTFKMSGSPVRSSYRNAMKAKVVKAVPHELMNFKENYDYLVYFDSKIHLNYNYTKTLICTWLETDFNIALLTTKHRQHFQTVDDEFQEALKQTRYRMHGKRMKEYIFMREHEHLMLQKKKNRISSVVDHPEGKDLKKNDDQSKRYVSETRFMIRSLKHPKIEMITNEWMKDIELCGIECQISFYFIEQKYRQYILQIDSTEYEYENIEKQNVKEDKEL